MNVIGTIQANKIVEDGSQAMQGLAIHWRVEKHGRVCGYNGVGVTPSELFGSSSKVHNLERRFNESEKRLHESKWQRKVEVQTLKNRISELKNCFEDRFQTIMAEMQKHVSVSKKRKNAIDWNHSRFQMQNLDYLQNLQDNGFTVKNGS